MADLIETVRAMPPEHQDVALTVLDMVTRPLTAREIERALLRVGVPRSRVVLVASALKNLAIVAVVGEQR